MLEPTLQAEIDKKYYIFIRSSKAISVDSKLFRGESFLTKIKASFESFVLIWLLLPRIALERAFNQNPKPTSEEVYYISESLNMEKVWVFW